LKSVSNIFKSIAAGILAAVLMIGAASAQTDAGAETSDDAYRRELEREAALNLIYLQRSIEKDGFYSARVALNVWRSSAIDAGTFDQKLYDELKLTLYQKSMSEALSCYNQFLSEKDYPNAKTCLQIWRSHAMEIDRFDPAEYQKLLAPLNKLKQKK
jgi:hypothetical protein